LDPGDPVAADVRRQREAERAPHLRRAGDPQIAVEIRWLVHLAVVRQLVDAVVLVEDVGAGTT
jgi:hypothetical protein